MEKQFSAMVVIDTMRINGKATLGENLADLGGLLIGLDAFKETKAFLENKSIAGYTPVSYTHLDVYKRQIQDLTVAFDY